MLKEHIHDNRINGTVCLLGRERQLTSAERIFVASNETGRGLDENHLCQRLRRCC